jgi:hypothetical protein
VKKTHAQGYIQMLIKLYFSDALPTKEGADGAAVLPYETVAKLFEEYQFYCSIKRIAPEQQAGETLFKSVYREMKDSHVVRLLGCKGKHIDFIFTYTL